MKKLSPEELEERTPEILGIHSNSYTITKHMAEHEIKKLEQEVPCAIVRPSMSEYFSFILNASTINKTEDKMVLTNCFK